MPDEPRHWRLNEKLEPVPCDLFEWARFFEDARFIASTSKGDLDVVTVFLGHMGAGEPIFFASAAIRRERAGEPKRVLEEVYSKTYEEAMEDHRTLRTKWAL